MVKAQVLQQSWNQSLPVMFKLQLSPKRLIRRTDPDKNYQVSVFSNGNLNPKHRLLGPRIKSGHPIQNLTANLLSEFGPIPNLMTKLDSDKRMMMIEVRFGLKSGYFWWNSNYFPYIFNLIYLLLIEFKMRIWNVLVD